MLLVSVDVVEGELATFGWRRYVGSGACSGFSGAVTAAAVAAASERRSAAAACGCEVGQRIAERAGLVTAALALRLTVVSREVRVLELLHRERGRNEPAAGDAVGDPQVDGPMNGQLEDVVGGEPQALLLLLL